MRIMIIIDKITKHKKIHKVSNIFEFLPFDSCDLRHIFFYSKLYYLWLIDIKRIKNYKPFGLLLSLSLF